MGFIKTFIFVLFIISVTRCAPVMHAGSRPNAMIFFESNSREPAYYIPPERYAPLEVDCPVQVTPRVKSKKEARKIRRYKRKMEKRRKRRANKESSATNL